MFFQNVTHSFFTSFMMFM